MADSTVHHIIKAVYNPKGYYVTPPKWMYDKGQIL